MSDDYMKNVSLQELKQISHECNEECNELRRGINYESSKEAPNYQLIIDMADDALKQTTLILAITKEINSREIEESLGADDSTVEEQMQKMEE